MSRQPLGAACVESGALPLTWPHVTIVVVVLILSVILALAGMPSLSVLVLLAEATDTGLRLARRLSAAKPLMTEQG
ncbi:hypothetical protein [Streptomyces sp. AgN23]|uniref:hypothetical protein n=1 Tax=Streptomyces sp. AgN23 TaxID=1188315 RepID=UPI001B32F896|nr:hypothetical protein [Streptomyces sp. AgN23]QTI87213.1 hypothetical protein AS97_39620 [Streptomyces sp. AgN23]WTB02799.1 hypothetical protein OG546_00045 [Streptomyces antimycoticus]WTB11321.1 hypothetical protein OG546_49075 [Streptomyces antimycoticus]